MFSVAGRIVNTQKQNRKVSLQTYITIHTQNVVVSENFELNLPAGESYDFQSGNMVIQKPNLWSPENL